MVTKEQIKKRLKRFQILSGLSYSKEAGDIWLEKFKDYKNSLFDRACSKVENQIKWHILPTPYDIFEAAKTKQGEGDDRWIGKRD